MLKLLVGVFLSTTWLGSIQTADIVDLGIIHYNDVYGQLQRIKTGSQPPVDCTSSDKKCIGGVAELMAHIKKVEEEDFKDINVLKFAAGNLISGENGWIRLLDESHGKSGFEQYGDFLVSTFEGLNYYQPNVSSLGPREFDGGIERLNSYMREFRGKVKPVVSNIDCTLAPTGHEKAFCDDLTQPYQIVELPNLKIGIVGFVDPLVVHQSEKGNLIFTDSVLSLKKAVKDLQDIEDGVNIIFAIGTGTLSLSKSILEGIPEIKLVVYGGGKNSDISDEEYPLKHDSRYIVTADKYAASFGQLRLRIDDNGNIVSVNGSARFKNDNTNPIEPIRAVITRIESMATKVAGVGNQVIGKTKVTLEGSISSCWKKECLLGDLVTDAMVHCAFNDNNFNALGSVISLWHSSGLSGGLLEHDSDVTKRDVHTWMAYNNIVTIVSLKGSVLRQIFNSSAQAIDETSFAPNWGQFLQVSSGVQLHYNNVEGEMQPTLIAIAQTDGNGLIMNQELEDTKAYWVVIPSFLYNGRNVYYYLPNNFELIEDGTDKIEISMDYVCLENYIKAMGVISFGHDERIFINTNPGEPTPVTTQSTSKTTTVNPVTSSTTLISTAATTSPEHSNPPITITTTTSTTEIPNSSTQSHSYFNKTEVIATSVGVTLVVVFVIIGAIIGIALIRKRLRIQHKLFKNDSFSSS